MKHSRFWIKFFYFTVLIIYLITPQAAQSRSVQVGENVVIFYPSNFEVTDTLPSLALVKEPGELGKIPEDWKMKVLFEKAFDKNTAWLKIDEETDLYGTGEVLGRLQRNGTRVQLWNTDNFGYDSKENGLRLYQSHPWVLGLRKNGTAFGILADTTWKMEMSLGSEIRFLSEGPPFRVFVIEGQSPQQVMKSLAELIGTIPLPPLWSLGYQQCRWSYYPDSRVKEIADNFRDKKMPCDVIWMDIHYMNQYRVFTFSPDLFPDPVDLNKYLHKKGFKSVWMIDPGVKFEKGYEVYDSGNKKDVWVKKADGTIFTGKVWPGACVFPDFTQPEVRTWWGDLYQKFMAVGIDGVWNDMNEPAVFDSPNFSMPENNIHKGGGRLKGDSHLRYHNVYGMLMVKASREGILKANPDKRPFVLTRSNFIGGQRYAATWTGDNSATWADMKMSIPMSINLGLSGQPFNGPDIGGFSGNASRELFGHWISVGAFYPFARSHTTHDSKNQEPWAFGEKIEKVSRIALERRYQLLPYLYTLFYEASVSGLPVMRPVFFADSKDIGLRREDQAFLLGSDLLIVPKWAKNVRMPKGNWNVISLDGRDSKKSVYQPDIHLRDGAVLPVGRVIQNTEEYSIKELKLYLSLDKNNKAKGLLYHDSGDGFSYKKGGFSLIQFKAELIRSNKLKLTAEKIKGKNSVLINKVKIYFVTKKGTVCLKSDFSKKMVFNLN